jgi:quercetin dioxygenase-like cupin family protein
MKVYRKGTGKKYTPFNHFDMTTQVIFNPDTGCPKVNATLTTLKKGSGSNDEIHETSDQLLFMMQGAIHVYAHGNLLETLSAGDALLIQAGDTHAVKNEEDTDAVFLAITVPPLDKTH